MAGPVIHCILVRFADGVDEATIDSFFTEAVTAARAQPGCIEAHAGKDLGISGSQWAGALVVRFRSPADYTAYMESDEHRKLAERFGALVSSKASTQFATITR